MKNWKLIAVAVTLPIFFYVVACQDQAESPTADVIEVPFKYPANVQETLSNLQREYPDDRFVVLPPATENPEILKKIKGQLVARVGQEDTYVADAITSVNVAQRDGTSLNYMIFQYKNGSNQPNLTIPDGAREVDGRPIFMVTEVPPSPPGGQEAFIKSVQQRVRYPESARKAGVEGSVYVRFVVWSDGHTSDFEVLKGISEECDMEAIRALQEQSTGWTAATQKGQSVNCRFIIPIKFKL